MDQKSLLFTPEGVRDIYGEDCEKRAKIQQGIHTIMKQYGFKNIQTPTFEFFDIFNRERGTVKSADMFKFFDQYNNTLLLRPDIHRRLHAVWLSIMKRRNADSSVLYRKYLYPLKRLSGKTFGNHTARCRNDE